MKIGDSNSKKYFVTKKSKIELSIDQYAPESPDPIWYVTTHRNGVPVYVGEIRNKDLAYKICKLLNENEE